MIIILLILCPGSAVASGPYVSASGGASFLESHYFHDYDFHYKNGLSLAGAVGWDFGIPRLEVENLYLTNDAVNKGLSLANGLGDHQSRTYYMLNVYIDIPLTEKFEGYIGAGYALFPASQLMGGLKYHITSRWDLNLGYKKIFEHWTPRPGGPEAIYTNHAVMGGVVFNF